MTGDWWRLVLVALALGSGAAVSRAYGVPAEIPGAGLGWPLLLHLERSVALLGLTIVALLVGVRAMKGRFPSRFGQLEYPADGVDRRDSVVTRTHEERLLLIEEMLEIAPQMDDLEGSRYDWR